MNAAIREQRDHILSRIFFGIPGTGTFEDRVSRMSFAGCKKNTSDFRLHQTPTEIRKETFLVGHNV
jgi:hypothetical protein